MEEEEEEEDSGEDEGKKYTAQLVETLNGAISNIKFATLLKFAILYV